MTDQTPQPGPAEQPVVTAPPPGGFSQIAPLVVLVALVVTLVAPFWVEALLGTVGLRTPVARVAAANGLSVERQDRKLADLDQRIVASTAEISRLQASLTQASRRQETVEARARTLAMVQLGVALRRNAPYEVELAMARATGADTPQMKPLLDQVEPYAVVGVPAMTQISQDFTRLSDRVLRSERGILPVAWVSDLVSWVRPGSSKSAQAADPLFDILQAASLSLAGSDLEGALTQAHQISGRYEGAFTAWIEDAEARVAADTLVSRLGEQVGKRLDSATAK